MNNSNIPICRSLVATATLAVSAVAGNASAAEIAFWDPYPPTHGRQPMGHTR